jgi:hypothetical protein
MTEEWRPVVGFEGAYEISNMGRLKSLPRLRPHPSGTGVYHIRGCIRKLSAGTGGYITAGLYAFGGSRNALVHVLVAEAFVPNPDNLPEVNHKDKVRTNNTPDNLEWITRVNNVTRGEECGPHKLTTGQVLEIRARLATGVKQTILAEIYGVDPSAISNIKRRRNWKHI